MGKSRVTRAITAADYSKGAIGNTEDTGNGVKSLAQARFGVFSYLTKSDYSNTTPTALAPNFMYNQEIQYDDALSWVYSPVKYWPNGIDSQNPDLDPSNTAEDNTSSTSDNKYGKNLSFFAYAPFMNKTSFNTDGTGTAGTDFPTALSANTNFKTVASPTNGIVAMTTNAFTGNAWVKYMLPTATESEAVDLLWGTRGTTNYDKAGSSATDGATVGESYNMNLTKQTVDERVSFLFKHALAKLGGSTTTSKDLTEPSAKCGFQVKLDVDGNKDDNQTDYFPSGFDNAKTLVTIKNVKIQDGGSADSYTTGTTTSDIYTSGWFNIETGSWDMTGATKGATINIEVQNNESADAPASNKYTINPKIREVGVKNATGANWDPDETSATADGYTGKAEGVEVTAKPLFADEYAPAIMLIPGNANQTLYVTIDYIVRTADANLSTGYTEVEQTITNKVELPNTVLKSNKVYNIIMHLGLTSVKFEAVVADWQKMDGSSLDEDGNETGGTSENEEHIWLPSNVVGTTSATSIASATGDGSTKTVNAAAGAGTYTITVTGLKNTTTATVTSSDGTNAAVTSPTAAVADGKVSVPVTLTINSLGSTRTFTITVTGTNSSDQTVKAIVTIKQAG